MGCQGPKSVISVRNDLTFLDLTVQQIEVRFFWLQKLLQCILYHDINFMIYTFMIFVPELKQDVQCKCSVGSDELV